MFSVSTESVFNGGSLMRKQERCGSQHGRVLKNSKDIGHSRGKGDGIKNNAK